MKQAVLQYVDYGAVNQILTTGTKTMNTLSLDENQVEVIKSYSVTPTEVVIGNWPVKKGTENLEFYLRDNYVYIAYTFNRITAGCSDIDNISNRITIKDNLGSYDYNLS